MSNTTSKKTVKKQVASKATEQKQENQPNHLLINAEVSNALIGYLKSKPMAEVENLVNALTKSRAVYVEEAEQKQS